MVSLENKLKERSAVVAIIGMGYVGLAVGIVSSPSNHRIDILFSVTVLLSIPRLWAI